MMELRGINRLLVILLAALWLVAARPALASNPTVPQGGSASFASTGHDMPANGPKWDIKNSSGVIISTYTSPSGWNVSINSSSVLTVSAPSSATIATNYEVR